MRLPDDSPHTVTPSVEAGLTDEAQVPAATYVPSPSEGLAVRISRQLEAIWMVNGSLVTDAVLPALSEILNW